MQRENFILREKYIFPFSEKYKQNTARRFNPGIKESYNFRNSDSLYFFYIALCKAQI